MHLTCNGWARRTVGAMNKTRCLFCFIANGCLNPAIWTHLNACSIIELLKIAKQLMENPTWR
jgi:hypothetical protein